MEKNPIAHVRQNQDNTWTEQPLSEHLKNVARLACQFAEVFGAGDWAKVCALWHDLGKYISEWQAHLRGASGYDPDAHLESTPGKINHSTAGAVLAFQRIQIPPIASIIAYVVAGHHAGLPDWYPGGASGAPLPERISKKNDIHELNTEDIQRVRQIEEARPFLETPLPQSAPFTKKDWHKWGDHLHLWIRMLYSCLVDADFLDTEAFMTLENALLRRHGQSMGELKSRFDRYMKKMQEKTEPSPVNDQRNRVLDLCREKAQMPPGFFTLTVPTGGGKTLSSIAFALGHAVNYAKRRIIVAIPYTSIIEQTAKVLQFGSDNDEKIRTIIERNEELFGEENVIEHHSNIDPESETRQGRLATENWDAPIIVTTNVQLFESLLAARSSSCRKLHNLANSVIILDEAQMLPPEYLKTITSVLHGLVEHFGVTIVLCTATQPVLSGTIGSGTAAFSGLPQCTEIMDDPSFLSKEFKRVHLHFPSPQEPPSSWEEIAEKVAGHQQCLAVVNSRKDCRTLHALLPDDTVHLSAFMCAEERSDVINGIKERLREKLPIRVVSTQLVEAGVDIDFPVVFRAMAGLDSIAQAAGRCNREGKLNKSGQFGQVFVFSPPTPAPPGLLRKGEDACRAILRSQEISELDPAIFSLYFRTFYNAVNTFDASDYIKDLCSESMDFRFQFRTQSQKFNLINDVSQQGVIVWYQGRKRSTSSLDYIGELRRIGPSRHLSRKMQRFTVTIPLYLHEKLMKEGMIEKIAGYSVQRSPGLYKEGLGLLPNPADWSKELLYY